MTFKKMSTNISIYKKYITWLASIWLLLGHAVTVAEKRDAAPADYNIWEQYRTEDNKDTSYKCTRFWTGA